MDGFMFVNLAYKLLIIRVNTLKKPVGIVTWMSPSRADVGARGTPITETSHGHHFNNVLAKFNT